MLLKSGSTGQKVRDAQWLLIGHNVFQISTLHEPIDGHFGTHTSKATVDMKWRLGYAKCSPLFGDDLFNYLIGKKKRSPAMIARARRRKRSTRNYPLGRKGTLIGFPGQGTHSWWAPPNNWESDNAVDIYVHSGTPVLAYADGTIGSQIGPLNIGGARFAGNRLHLKTKDNEFYYAHLQSLSVKAGQHVVAGQKLGYSGIANGVPHLHWAAKYGNPVTLIKGL